MRVVRLELAGYHNWSKRFRHILKTYDIQIYLFLYVYRYGYRIDGVSRTLIFMDAKKNSEKLFNLIAVQ